MRNMGLLLVVGLLCLSLTACGQSGGTADHGAESDLPETNETAESPDGGEDSAELSEQDTETPSCEDNFSVDTAEITAFAQKIQSVTAEQDLTGLAEFDCLSRVCGLSGGPLPQHGGLFPVRKRKTQHRFRCGRGKTGGAGHQLLKNLKKKCAPPMAERTLIVWHFSTGSAAAVEKAGTCRAFKRLFKAMPMAVLEKRPPVLNSAWKTFCTIRTSGGTVCRRCGFHHHCGEFGAHPPAYH